MRDETVIWNGSDPRDVVSCLEWAINSEIVDHLREHLVVHAGAVALDGRGVILPGASGSGKTTLVAGLIASGFQYLSDEAAVLDPRTRAVLPFAKSLYVHRQARDVLAAAYPDLARAAPYRQQDGEEVWYLTPRPDWLPSGPIPLRHVVVPRFVPGSPPTLVPISRSAALQCLIDQSFNLKGQGAQGIGSLVAILRETSCHALTFDDLDAATMVMKELVKGDER